MIYHIICTMVCWQRQTSYVHYSHTLCFILPYYAIYNYLKHELTYEGMVLIRLGPSAS